jgi:hypothetical protein
VFTVAHLNHRPEDENLRHWVPAAITATTRRYAAGIEARAREAYAVADLFARTEVS